MKVEKVDPSRKSFNDYHLDSEGAILIIGGVIINLAAEQEDQEKVIIISDHAGTLKRGMMPCCRYVAEVVIPPRQYEEAEIEDEGGEQETHTEYVPVPLDMNSVVLKLWPEEAQGENQQEGENNA